MFEGIFQPTHLILILAIVLIIFGPGKLPMLGKTLGAGIREFRDSVGQMGDTIKGTETVTTTPVAAATTYTVEPAATTTTVVEVARADGQHPA